jgi:hypothetical protein
MRGAMAKCHTRMAKGERDARRQRESWQAFIQEAEAALPLEVGPLRGHTWHSGRGADWR